LSTKPIRLLLAVDDSEYSPHVAEVASRLFSADDLVVYVLSVVEDLRGPGTEVGAAEVKQQERERFIALHSRIRSTYFTARNDSVESLILEGSPAVVVCERAKALGVDLIIMGTRGRSRFQAALLGSVSEDVILKANVPVMVVRRPE
jgi:nucleotide-binding universal stress UspA family protein